MLPPMDMQATTRSKLQKAGWKIGTVEEFLALTEEESACIERKLAERAARKQTRS